MSSKTLSLNLEDYIVFVSTLAFSTLIGIYYGCFGTKQATTQKYLLGGRKMKILPVGVSVAVSHISGTLLLGVVADVYRYGASIWLMSVAHVVTGLLAVFVYLPVLFKIQATNIFDYLEKRFDRRTRTLAFVLYILCEILKFPVLAYTPSLTFATASGSNKDVSGYFAFILCFICVFYTSIGGLKTVVWSDFFQFGIIMASLVTIYTIGVWTSGGFLTIWNAALDGDSFDINPTVRDSFWGYFIGATAMFTSSSVVHQTGSQKFLSLPKYKDSVWCTVYSVISMSLIHTLSIFIGLAVYAKYRDCDPLSSHMVSKHDQVFPYFVADVGANLSGISGLFIAAICSAALSSMSSNLNALSGVIYKDVVCRYLQTTPSEKRGSNILKAIVLVVGLASSCLVLLVDRMGEILSIGSLISGITQGPILGLFTLGVLFPKANHKGAFFGMIGGSMLVACLTIPTKYYQMIGLLKNPTKSLSINGCDLFGQTINTTGLAVMNSTNLSEQVPVVFKTSFHYYTFIGAAITMIFGLIISCLTKTNQAVHKDVLSPIVHRCLFKKYQGAEEVPFTSVERALDILGSTP